MIFNVRLAMLALTKPFREKSMVTVTRNVVGKYSYLLQQAVRYVDDETDIDESDYEPVNDLVETMMLSCLFPYMKDVSSSINMRDVVENLFKVYIGKISVDLLNEKADIYNKITKFNEPLMIQEFKNIFSMCESYWDFPVKTFISENSLLLGKLTSYTYDSCWNPYINETTKRGLYYKIDRILLTLTKRFSSFFVYDEYMDVKDINTSVNNFLHNYQELYRINNLLLNNVNNDIDVSLLILSKMVD